MNMTDGTLSESTLPEPARTITRVDGGFQLRSAFARDAQDGAGAGARANQRHGLYPGASPEVVDCRVSVISRRMLDGDDGESFGGYRLGLIGPACSVVDRTVYEHDAVFPFAPDEVRNRFRDSPLSAHPARVGRLIPLIRQFWSPPGLSLALQPARA